MKEFVRRNEDKDVIKFYKQQLVHKKNLSNMPEDEKHFRINNRKKVKDYLHRADR